MKKYRHELKFIINKNMANILKNKLKYVMDIDFNSDGPYTIRSLYFDNYKNESYYDKISGVLNRKKYRLRIYNYNDCLIKLECKEKNNNMCLKRSIKIDKETALKLIAGDININNDNELINEIVNEIRINKLKPSIIVDYKRLAFTYPISNVRVTFDSEISSGINHFNMFDNDFNTVAMINDDIIIMEVKYDDILPSHIDLILQSVPTYRQAVSKFVMCKEIEE